MDVPNDDEPRFHDPSKLAFQSNGSRWAILAAYWAVFILAAPIWWHTTSIERLALPAARVFVQAAREPVFPISVELDTRDAQIASETHTLLARKAVMAGDTWGGLDVTVTAKKDGGMYRLLTCK
jgi:phosphatidylinositol glycan class S